MSDISGFSAEAQKIMLALEYGAKVKWNDAFSAAKELVTNPANAVTDGSADQLLIDTADVLKAIGLFVPPVAIVANDLAVAASLEPLVVGGFGMIMALGGGVIPAETTATETNIEDQLGPNHGDRGY